MALTNVKGGNRKPKNRANKIHLVFDETKRRDFLTGFRKRKLQRKKEAQEKLEKELKEERKRLKSEAKESYKKLIISHRDIPELENLHTEEYEEDNVTVKVVELSANDIVKQNNWIGANQSTYEPETEIEIDENSKSEEIPGMSLSNKQVKKENLNKTKFESERELKKQLKKQATKNIQKSKVFQKKNKVEQQKQKKQAFKLKKQNDVRKHKLGRKGGKISKKHKQHSTW